jgi:hypothetical protein
MQKKLIILVNRESLCAYSLQKDFALSPEPAIEKIDVELHPTQPDPTKRSDDDGRFPGGSSIGRSTAMKHGEAHGRKTEQKKRQLSDLAKAICDLVNQEECDMRHMEPSHPCQPSRSSHPRTAHRRAEKTHPAQGG